MKKFLRFLYQLIVEIVGLPIGILINIGVFIYSIWVCIIRDGYSFREFISEYREAFMNIIRSVYEYKKNYIINGLK